jgi:hypothetical protein
MNEIYSAAKVQALAMRGCKQAELAPYMDPSCLLVASLLQL